MSTGRSIHAWRTLCRGQSAGAMRGRVASSAASFRWQRKSEDWHAMASLATTPPLHRWAILPPRPRGALLKMVAATKGNETEMSHASGSTSQPDRRMGRAGPQVFRHQSGRHGLTLSASTPCGTSIWGGVPVVESGDPAASPEEIADLIAGPRRSPCALWLTPIGASAAKDVLSRSGLTTGPPRCARSTPMPLA